jgi:hypothetical protein
VGFWRLYHAGVSIPGDPRRGPVLPGDDTPIGAQAPLTPSLTAAVPCAGSAAAGMSEVAAREQTGEATPSPAGSRAAGELCVTCQVRVGQARATVLHAVVCGPCWAAHGGSPDADEIGPAPTVTVPSWDPRDQRHWLSALRRQDWVLDIRADGRANLLAVARLVALHAEWNTLESRPTWARLISRSGLSERTVARWLQELRVRGWLAHLEHGSTPAHRPMVLAHLTGNRAAVYGLRIPLTPEEALHRAAEQLAEDLANQDPPAPPPSPPAPTTPTSPDLTAPAHTPQPTASHQHQPPTSGDTTGTPSWSFYSLKESWVHGFTRASKTVDNLGTNPTERSQNKDQKTALRAGQEANTGPNWAITVPASRFAMLIAADWLRHRLPVFASCSRKLVRHLCKPYWHAGWSNRDILHAMDHRPGLFGQTAGVLISPERIAAPKAFIASRLRAWHTPQGAILPGYWTSRRTDATATRTARRHIAARHGHTGAALLRPGERALTAQRIAQHRHLLITHTRDGTPIPGPARLVHLDPA